MLEFVYRLLGYKQGARFGLAAVTAIARGLAWYLPDSYLLSRSDGQT